MQPPLAFLPVHPRQRFAEPGDEVVAPRLVAVPPAAFDALGAGEQGELVLIEDFWRLEQPCRPRSRLHEMARIPVAGLDAPPGVLGTVVGAAGAGVPRVLPQARLQPLAEPRPVFGLGGRVA